MAALAALVPRGAGPPNPGTTYLIVGGYLRRRQATKLPNGSSLFFLPKEGTHNPIRLVHHTRFVFPKQIRHEELSNPRTICSRTTLQTFPPSAQEQLCNLFSSQIGWSI